ncbi:hypothetical protein [Mesorhizobium sp. M0968]|uniref:hypothetical protein n=1 Tax=Mesorhizobium sp. M0968 TaxID=2957037 RepID=UPI003334B9D0
MGRPKGSIAPNKTSLTGQRFGRLVVLADGGRTRHGQIRWHCRCDCGGETFTISTKLRSGHTQSCGCYKLQRCSEANVIHGLFIGGNHELKDVFKNMKARCYDPRRKDYARYGGRGVTVCDRWLNGADGKTAFQCFVEDVGTRPSPDFSIDRFPIKDGNYEPGNVRWADATGQARNRRSNRMVDCDGEQVALSEFCERKGFDFAIVNDRVCRGWSFERAINQPVRKAG